MSARMFARGFALAGAAAMVIGSAGAGFAAQSSPARGAVDVQLRQHPGGVQTGPNEVSYNNGRVVVSFPGDDKPGSCDGHRVCFYDGTNFTGAQLTIHCGTTLSTKLADYGFADRISSYYNNSDNAVFVFEKNQPSDPWSELWAEGPQASSVDVGAASDRADLFSIYCIDE
ncbi:hypothetical protein GCM10022254_23200 [Actinomadura meridiana]|uniref:Secreted protein n=1 Tax=Actinomadura meridiana TaxID=559626 RepID=A0ABP8BY80_9ACTN